MKKEKGRSVRRKGRRGRGERRTHRGGGEGTDRGGAGGKPRLPLLVSWNYSWENQQDEEDGWGKGEVTLSLSLSAVAEVLCSVVFFGLDLGLGDGFSLLSNIDFLYYYHTTLSLFCFFLLVSFLFFSF